MTSDFITKDLYSILGVSPSANKLEIKAAFRYLAKKYHPDINKGDKISEKKFKDIAFAYEILSDEIKRKDYDKRNGFNQSKNTYSDTKHAEKSYKRTTQYSYKKEPNFSSNKKDNDYSKIFTEFVNEFFSSKDSPEAINGEDITLDLTLTIKEAQTGTIRRVNVMRNSCCPTCKGKKFVNDSKCKNCNGQGTISDLKTIMVKIPSGIIKGEKIILKNEGNQGKYGGKNGDLILKINIEKDEIFRFDGLNVLSDVALSPTEAALGTTITIPAIDGHINLKIPPETSSGQKFKLNKQGIFDKNKNIYGDHIVTVFIKMPKNLSAQEKELYNKLARLRDFNPRGD